VAHANIDLVIPFDTTPEIAAMQAQILDSMSGEQRVLLSFEMSHYVHELAKQGIRDLHPDWPEDRVTREFLRSLFPPGEEPPGF
jgi:hypothetical protein